MGKLQYNNLPNSDLTHFSGHVSLLGIPRSARNDTYFIENVGVDEERLAICSANRQPFLIS